MVFTFLDIKRKDRENNLMLKISRSYMLQFDIRLVKESLIKKINHLWFEISKVI